jgi:hypothetical protein
MKQTFWVFQDSSGGLADNAPRFRIDAIFSGGATRVAPGPFQGKASSSFSRLARRRRTAAAANARAPPMRATKRVWGEALIGLDVFIFSRVKREAGW